MDYSKIAKFLLILSLLLAAFFAGLNYERVIKNAEIADLKRQYAEANEAEQKRIVEDFNAKQTELEKTLSDARAREFAANTSTERMRQQLSEMSRATKNAESKQSIRFARLAVRCKSILDRASTALEFCAKVTE